MADMNESPPKDKFFVVYIASVIVLGSTDYPWKSLSAGIDYFQYLYPDYQPEIAFFLILNAMSLLFIVLTLLTIHLLPVFYRVAFSSVVLFCSLSFIPLLDIGIHNCTVDITVAFGLTLIAVLCIGIAIGIQQSSLFGLSGMLPPRYTQASSVGMSLASILSCVLRAVTKVSFNEERYGAIAFIVVGIIMILMGIVCQIILWSSKFVKYHIKKASEKPTTIDQNIEKNNGEIDNIEMVSSPSNDHNNDHNNGTEVVVSDTIELVSTLVVKKNFKKKLFQLRKQLKWRFFVFKKIWKILLVVFLVYFVTFVLHPSLLSEVQYCAIGDWTPLLLLSCFSIFDVIGRYVVFVPLKWTPNWLLFVSIIRFIFIPLILLSLVPSPTRPIVTPSAGLGVAMVTIGLMGFTHGYFVTKSLTTGPTLVDYEHRELAGNMAMLSVFIAGALSPILAYSIYPLTQLEDYTPCIENYTATFSCINN